MTCTNPRNYYRYRGRPLVSTFGGEVGVDWKEMLGGLRSEGIAVCFIPFFYPRPNVTELPDFAAIKEHFAKWNTVADGYFFFGGAGTAGQLAQCNADYTQAAHEDHKLCMASYSPFYWGTAQPGRRYFETEGGAGVERQWRSIITSQPDFVEIVTWNDFNESYICPTVSPEQHLGELALPYRHSHAGYLELSTYYIRWYKSGRAPKIGRDALFYFYRVHPRGAVALPPALGVPSSLGEPVGALHGDVQDALYVTTMLTAPTELLVSSGGTPHRFWPAPGVQHFRIPFRPGPQRFELYRRGKRLLALDGTPIQRVPRYYDFFPVTGFGYPK